MEKGSNRFCEGWSTKFCSSLIVLSFAEIPGNNNPGLSSHLSIWHRSAPIHGLLHKKKWRGIWSLLARLLQGFSLSGKMKRNIVLCNSLHFWFFVPLLRGHCQCNFFSTIRLAMHSPPSKKWEKSDKFRHTSPSLEHLHLYYIDHWRVEMNGRTEILK